MSFKDTEQSIHDFNTSPTAKLPMLNDISANMVGANNGIKFSFEKTKEVEESFKIEYNENCKNKTPFFGSPHDIFLKSYYEDLKVFLKQYEDGNEADFIEAEFSLGIMKFEFPFAGDYMNAVIRLSLKRRFEFLVERLHILGYDFQYYVDNDDNYTLGYKESFKIIRILNFKNEQEKHTDSIWVRSQHDLAEIVNGLYLAKSFSNNVSEKEIAKVFELAFNFKFLSLTLLTILRAFEAFSMFLNSIKIF